MNWVNPICCVNALSACPKFAIGSQEFPFFPTHFFHSAIVGQLFRYGMCPHCSFVFHHKISVNEIDNNCMTVRLAFACPFKIIRIIFRHPLCVPLQLACDTFAGLMNIWINDVANIYRKYNKLTANAQRDNSIRTHVYAMSMAIGHARMCDVSLLCAIAHFFHVHVYLTWWLRACVASSYSIPQPQTPPQSVGDQMVGKERPN